MSVPKGKREEAKTEFLYNARQLAIHTIKKCTGFPKRYTFYLGQPLANEAVRVYEDVKKANSLYPLTKHEAQIRRDWFLDANSVLHSMVSLIEMAEEMFGLDAKTIAYWMDMVNKEIRLVQNVMKSDRQRYKDLPDT